MKSRQGRVAPLVELTSELLARRPDQKRKMDDFDLAEAEADPRRVARRGRAAPLVELTSELLARRPDMKSRQGQAPPLVEYQSELLARRPEDTLLAKRLA